MKTLIFIFLAVITLFFNGCTTGEEPVEENQTRVFDVAMQGVNPV